MTYNPNASVACATYCRIAAASFCSFQGNVLSGVAFFRLLPTALIGTARPLAMVVIPLEHYKYTTESGQSQVKSLLSIAPGHVCLRDLYNAYVFGFVGGRRYH